jgi:hypothetical protein
MFAPIHIDKEFTIIPNNLYLILHNGNEALLLLALIQFQGTNANSKKSCYVSISTLCKWLITNSRNKVSNTIQSLYEKGYIDYIKGNTNGKANEYSVNMDKILKDIRHAQTDKEVGKKAELEYSEQQKDMMSAKRVGKNKKLLVVANRVGGYASLDKETGDIIE